MSVVKDRIPVEALCCPPVTAGVLDEAEAVELAGVLRSIHLAAVSRVRRVLLGGGLALQLLVASPGVFEAPDAAETIAGDAEEVDLVDAHRAPGGLESLPGALVGAGAAEAGNDGGVFGGAWMVWQGVREHRGLAWVGAGVAALAAYGFVATFQHDPRFGRILAAYGGIFVAGSLAWGVVLDGFRPDRYDIVGAFVRLVGVAVIMYAPRPG